VTAGGLGGGAREAHSKETTTPPPTRSQGVSKRTARSRPFAPCYRAQHREADWSQHQCRGFGNDRTTGTIDTGVFVGVPKEIKDPGGAAR